MLDHLHVRRLLLAHARGLDVVREDVLAVRRNYYPCYPDGRRVIDAVVGAVGVPGEVGGASQQESAEVEPVHQAAEALASYVAGHGRTTSAPLAGRKV